MYKYLLFLIPLLTIACKPSVKVTPDTLPDAYINQPYKSNIRISGGAVVELNFHSEISDSNFTVTPDIAEEGYKDYNLLTVTGTPTLSKPIHIYIAGDTYGTNFPGERFEKTYTIKVHDKNVDK